MTQVELWELVFQGLTAVGTVGAVIISLWLARPHWKRYTVKYIRVSCMINADKSQESAMLIMIENHQNAPMEIQYVEIVFRYNIDNHTAHQQWNYKNEFIPPISQYEIKAPLTQEWNGDELRKADEVTVSLKTSLGDKTIDFPKSYLPALFRSMEVSNKEKEEAA